jgi:hypothetical protein
VRDAVLSATIAGLHFSEFFPLPLAWLISFTVIWLIVVGPYDDYPMIMP